MTKLVLGMILAGAAALPSSADVLLTVGNYNIYDCGQTGTAAYQACQQSMAMGEQQFMSTYQPSGIPWNDAYLNELTVPPGAIGYAVAPQGLSGDGLWAVILLLTGFNGNVDGALPAYTWHDGTFMSISNAASGIDVRWYGAITINDQGEVAGLNGSGGVLLDDLWVSFNDFIWAGLPAWSASRGAPLIFNDEGQMLVEGIESEDWMLFNPAGAPVPGVPEPASLVLLSSAILAAILIRRTHFSGFDKFPFHYFSQTRARR